MFGRNSFFSSDGRPYRLPRHGLGRHGTWVPSLPILLLALVLVRTNPAIGQEAAPNETASNGASKACDLAAASPYDKQRPADVPGVAYDALAADVAIPACEAAVRAAPQDSRMLYQLARGYRRAKRFADALPLYQRAAEMGNALGATDLSVMYGRGEGVEVDLKAQLNYVDQAARTGLSVAEYDYGVLYEKGNAVLPKDENLARQLITLAAKDNFPKAMFKLGFMLERGIGGNKDEVEARYWYEKAAEAGDYAAMNNFGYFLQTGKGGPRDLGEARKWFEKSASGNSAIGTNSLGVMFRDGLAGPQDLEEARRLFKKAIALGEKQYAAKNLERLDQTYVAIAPGVAQGGTVQNAPTNEAATNPAQGAGTDVQKACDLAAASPADKQRPADVPGVTDATNIRNAVHGTLDPSLAVPACEAAVRAAPQDPRMLYQLARSYRDAKRLAEALSLYQQAAQMGNAPAAYDLSVMYKYGAGVAVDLKAQLYYLDQAARAGLSEAEDDYGVLYIQGNAVLPKDEKLGRQLISLAAQDNDPLAMNNMAFVLDQGIGGDKDEVEARSWYEKAAKAGNYKAMNSLGFKLMKGIAGKQDLVEARQWYQKSAEGNDPNGTNSLGGMFERGWGGPRDLGEARRLYKRAIALGEKQFAAKNLEKLDAAAGQ